MSTLHWHLIPNYERNIPYYTPTPNRIKKEQLCFLLKVIARQSTRLTTLKLSISQNLYERRNTLYYHVSEISPLLFMNSLIFCFPFIRRKRTANLKTLSPSLSSFPLIIFHSGKLGLSTSHETKGFQAVRVRDVAENHTSARIERRITWGNERSGYT